jgi:hypothetical protein
MRQYYKIYILGQKKEGIFSLNVNKKRLHPIFFRVNSLLFVIIIKFAFLKF